MKSKYLILLCFLLPFFGCKKDKNIDSEVKESEAGSIEDVNVGNGFDFETHQTVAFELTTVDSMGTEKGPIKMKIYGLDNANQKDELFSGSSNSQAKLNLALNVPIHFKNILIVTDSEGSIFQYEFPVSSAITQTLRINGSFIGGEVDTRSNNCYPSVSSTFTVDNKGVSLTSDEKMTTIKVYYTDGTSEVIPINAKSISF
ncbi:MAG: hypothetical protein AB8H03_01190 [Saprospiraceae bacterium]